MFVTPEKDGASSVACSCTMEDSNRIGDVFGDTRVAANVWGEVAGHGDGFGEVGEEGGLGNGGGGSTVEEE